MFEFEDENTVVETHEEWALRKRRESMKVTRYQAKAALLGAGLLADIESTIAASEDPLIKLAWAEASFDRLSTFAEKMLEITGLTDEQLDNLFEAAATIN